ncbi:Uncharacterized protein PECH_005893 [Penicillium ucsense]|uniref:Copper acquisition factor BIM1-like domain-containing protein n=1 Tax=Penicillium ucsense TaxID=2839758 RepID=A0A8J8WJI1_9EURO|nr:Uncharacterized protein PECM_000694 [Penicillium ucsense]KAF7736075.1 Uncharacterized protein PECH_005893 [Penicillium ucsense]
MSLQQLSWRWMALVAISWTAIAQAHSIITYPGYRGDNLHTNGTVAQANGLGIAYDPVNGSLYYPYGMEWAYPCGGMPTSKNRTYWPIGGGAVAVQPGWFQGHSTALIYINMGFGEVPENMSHPVVPPFQIVGPTNDPYPGTICLTQIPIPQGINVKVGDKATIQVVEAAKHGAALYNCVDIIFAENGDSKIKEVTADNCFNSSDIGFQYMYTTTGIGSGAEMLQPLRGMWLAFIPLLLSLSFL